MAVLRFLEFGDASKSRWASAARWRWVERCWAMFGLLLILATWRLWIPQQAYPQVPLVSLANTLPAACNWAALAVVTVSLLAILLLQSRLGDVAKSWLFRAVVAAMLVLIVSDQHRLQPWAYQLVIYAIVLGTAPNDPINRQRAIRLLQILTLSIYTYSALGKLDYQFLHTVGQQFLGVTLGVVGIDVEPWPLSIKLLLTATFPVAELLIVVALLVPRLRRVGVWFAVILHASLLVVLGPVGLQHQPGVLIWNVFFATQVVALFSGSPQPIAGDDETPVASQRMPRRWMPTGVVMAVVLLPLLEPTGWFDHWPSWGLYSPRNSRATVEVHRAGIPHLPAKLQRYLVETDANASWVALKIDDWSLESLSVPIYPQDRFQLGVAESIANRYGLDRTIRVRLWGMSNRMSGTRKVRTLTGRQQIVAVADRFRLNAHPTGSSG